MPPGYALNQLSSWTGCEPATSLRQRPNTRIQVNLFQEQTHIAQESGAESSAIKNILGHSNLATTERYMGSFDTTKTDNTLRSLFKKKMVGADGLTDEERVQQAVELLKDMPPEQIMAVISAINK